MPKSKRRTIVSGYCYQFSPIPGEPVGWRGSSAEDWDIEIYSPVGGEILVGQKTIDGAPCAVFFCSDSVFRAQTHVSTGGAEIV